MTAEQGFLRRMLWLPGEAAAPAPVVALLGPRGAGKSTTLRTLSRECGGTVVHARLDFGEHPDLDPIAAAAFVAFQLMRGWTNLRRRPVFHRLGLCLLALNEKLGPDRDVAKDRIKELIRQYAQRTPLGRIGQRVPDLLFNATQVAVAVSGIAGTPQAADVQAIHERAKPVIAALLHGVNRLGLREAIRWYRTLPDAEDAGIVDTLIALSTGHRAQALGYVMQALLADIDNFTRRHRAAAAPCDCLPPADLRGDHEHAWVLLVDNAHSATGQAFLSALVAAKEHRLDADVAAGDPLLTVTAAGQWYSSWSNQWREPWSANPARTAIPRFSRATRTLWADAAGPAEGEGRIWYPVWLDPAADLGAPPLITRLAAGHPQAVIDLRERIGNGGRELPRPMLAADGDDNPLWDETVRACLPDALPEARQWPELPPAVAVTAYLAHPARYPDDPPASVLPGAGAAVRQLRTDLWVSTFTKPLSPLTTLARGEGYPAMVHPWLARCLLAGLAAQPGLSSWDKLFEDIYAAQTDPGPAHELFRDLAQHKFGDVVAGLVKTFDTIDHRAWVRLLDDTTHAPCRCPALEPVERTYRRLSPDHVPGRSAVEAAVTSLVTLLWLDHDPLTELGKRWRKRISSDFRRLASRSGRADVSALEAAARQFAF